MKHTRHYHLRLPITRQDFHTVTRHFGHSN